MLDSDERTAESRVPCICEKWKCLEQWLLDRVNRKHDGGEFSPASCRFENCSTLVYNFPISFNTSASLIRCSDDETREKLRTMAAAE